MDNRPIGVFDSGLGGLTSLKEMFSLLPGEDIIYFGDTGRVPYGGRSVETILKYAAQDFRFLRTFDIKAILVACGTVSSVLRHRTEEPAFPVVGVVEPAAARACALTQNRRIGIIGTVATIGSGSYESMLKKLLPTVETKSQACPLFVPLVENGRFFPGDPVIEIVAREYLEPFLSFGCDTLIMGCTHYPLLKPIIASILPGVHLIDVGREASNALKTMLQQSEGLSSRTAGGAVRYFVSDDPVNFVRLGSIFMEQNITSSVQQINIEQF